MIVTVHSCHFRYRCCRFSGQLIAFRCRKLRPSLTMLPLNRPHRRSGEQKLQEASASETVYPFLIFFVWTEVYIYDIMHVIICIENYLSLIICIIFSFLISYITFHADYPTFFHNTLVTAHHYC